LAKKYGKLVPKIAQTLPSLDGTEAKSELDKNGVLKFEIDGEPIELLSEEVEINKLDKEGYVTETDNGIFVTLSTTLSEELIEEGFAREIINKIQFMRKEADFNVVDRIRLYINSTDVINDVLKNHRDYIMSETLTREVLDQEESGMFAKEWSINGENATIAIKQIAQN